jgi:hypothetical protein
MTWHHSHTQWHVYTGGNIPWSEGFSTHQHVAAKDMDNRYNDYESRFGTVVSSVRG